MNDAPRLSVEDLVLDRGRYASLRAGERARVMATRAARRVQLGDRVALEFENAETLRYQAQVMVFVEGITDEAAAAGEIAAYSRMLPDAGSLTATFLVELDDAAAVKAELTRLRGLHRSIWIRAGSSASHGEEIPGVDESGPSEETASVHFLRFHLDAGLRAALASGTPAVTVSAEHPEYSASVTLDGGLRARLAADLAEPRVRD